MGRMGGSQGWKSMEQCGRTTCTGNISAGRPTFNEGLPAAPDTNYIRLFSVGGNVSSLPYLVPSDSIVPSLS